MLDGAKTAVASRITGLGRSARPLIVCVHGGGCNGSYFDLPGFSFQDRAIARGYPVLLVDRPGHGNSLSQDGGDFRTSAAAVMDHVKSVLSAYGLVDWFLVGHSIGAAVAMIIAGTLPATGLRGMAVSGIGDRPTAAALESRRKAHDAALDAGLSDLLFGPQESYSWRGPMALRYAAEPWRLVEVEESLDVWPGRFASSAGGVRVPVHFRLAEAERIWETGPAVVARLASLFRRAPCVNAALLPEGGHLYEVHRRGAELMDSQLDFFNAVTQNLDSGQRAGIPAAL